MPIPSPPEPSQSWPSLRTILRFLSLGVPLKSPSPLNQLPETKEPNAQISSDLAPRAVHRGFPPTIQVQRWRHDPKTHPEAMGTCGNDTAIGGGPMGPPTTIRPCTCGGWKHEKPFDAFKFSWPEDFDARGHLRRRDCKLYVFNNGECTSTRFKNHIITYVDGAEGEGKCIPAIPGKSFMYHCGGDCEDPWFRYCQFGEGEDAENAEDA